MPFTTDTMHSRTPFIRLLLIPLLSVSIITGLLSPWIVFSSSWREARSHTIATAEHLLALLADEAAGVIAFNDVESGQVVAVKYVNLPDVQSAHIRRNDGVSFAVASVERTRFALRTVELQADIMSDVFSTLESPGVNPPGEPVVIGSVTLVVQLDRARVTSLSTAIQSAAQIAAMTMLLCIVMVLVSRRTLAPLADLAKAVRDPSAMNGHIQSLPMNCPPGVPFPVPPAHASAEVHVIYDAIEALRVRIIEAQRILRSYADRLENDNEQKARHIGAQEMKLRAALAVAESANRAKSLFLANVSHELRTPLQAIILHARLAISSGSPDHISGSLEVVLRSSSNLLELIDQLLDISKSEATNTINIAYQKIDLQSFLRDTIVDIDKTIQNNNSLTLRYNGNPSVFVCDPLRLRQIIINLVRNADKATCNGFIELAISEESNTGLLLLSVSDTGCGMTEEVSQCIFDIFYQDDPLEEINAPGKGIGLGLFLTRNIVTALHGTIAVHSVLGQGTRFDVHLPIEPQAQAFLYETSGQEDDQSTTVQPRSIHILFAEDEDIIREPLIIFLNEASISVDESCDGYQAEKFIDKQITCYDALVLDNRMPGPTGANLLQHIRQHHRCSVPVLLLTGDENEELYRLCADLGATLLYKPIQPESLIAAIHEAVATTSR